MNCKIFSKVYFVDMLKRYMRYRPDIETEGKKG